jgi:hypothetical protein
MRNNCLLASFLNQNIKTAVRTWGYLTHGSPTGAVAVTSTVAEHIIQIFSVSCIVLKMSRLQTSCLKLLQGVVGFLIRIR